VGRRPGPLIVLAVAALAGCSGPRPAAPDAAARSARVVAPTPPPAPRPPPADAGVAPDAPEEPPAEPIRPGDVLQGPAAEQAIGESAPAPRPAPQPDEPALLVSPLGVGPYALGLPRQALIRLLPTGAGLVRARTAPGEPSIEHGDVFEAGVHLLRVVLYAGRLVEVTVLARDRRAVTLAEIGVGATFEDAELAHGDPRKVKRGWVLSALPGVVFAPADAALLAAERPPPEARVGHLIVVGPEAD
jgi:hypothetical protein